jgi:hypothetical protein
VISTDLETVRQEYGFAAKVFLGDWDGRLKEHFVVGVGELKYERLDGHERIIGAGGITPGEKKR